MVLNKPEYQRLPMVHDRALLVRSVLVGLASPGWGGVSLDVEGSGIASGCPEAYTRIFRFLLRRFWGVIGDEFVAVGARASARSGAVGHLTAGEGSVSAAIDVGLGLPSKGNSHGLAYRRIVRFNREVLGMNKMYLLEAQFVRPNGFRERKMDMVLDMVKALKDREESKGRLQGGQVASGEVEGSAALIAPRTSLPGHVLARFAKSSQQPVELTMRDVDASSSERTSELMSAQDPIRLTNPLFSLSETGSSLESPTMEDNPDDKAMDVTRVGFPVVPEALCEMKFSAQFRDSSLDAKELRLDDVAAAVEGEGAIAVATVAESPFRSLLEALQDRVSSVRQLLGDECSLSV